MDKKTIFTKEHHLIVERLKQARTEAGIDQIQAAKLTGRTQSFISKLESGQRRIDIVQLKEFCKVYGKTMDYFIKEK